MQSLTWNDLHVSWLSNGWAQIPAVIIPAGAIIPHALADGHVYNVHLIQTDLLKAEMWHQKI